MFNFTVLILSAFQMFSPPDDLRSPSDYINPFIGTLKYGHTFPGAVAPWGMVSVSPHTAPNTPSGYIYGNPYFYGLGMNHLSGTGCADLGSVIVTAVKDNISDDPELYKTTYSEEICRTGYYSVYLEKPGIRTEATATTRSGLFKLTSPEGGMINVILDAGNSLAITGGGSLKILSQTELEGSNISGGFCGEANRQTVYFAARFSRSSEKSGIISSGKEIAFSEYKVQDSTLVSWFRFRFNPGDSLLIKIGLSYTSTENAWNNLEAESKGWDFNQTLSDLRDCWDKTLERITVADSDQDNKIKFYTALYHMLIHPSIISDVSGDYPLMGRKGTGNNKARPRYSVFSLWDTYRTLHPFLTLIYPEIQSQLLSTMIDMYKENGFFPKWELIGNETYMMVGDPSVPVIADSYIKGISDFDTATAFDAMLKPVILRNGEDAPPVRAGYHELLEYNYIPFEQDWNSDWWVWGPVSTTLEYCFADWCIHRYAEKFGHKKYSQEFFKRSMYYKNLFDRSTMFFRPKMKDGSWLTPFDSLSLEGSGDWQGSGGPGYVEGNAWTYSWFVPYDIKGLINLYGGEKNFFSRLNRFFSDSHFTIGNEPDIHYPYLFREIKNREYLTPAIVKKIMDTQFGSGADGLPGDDDCGTISAWFVFSALGFYPVCPASDEYTLTTPLFDKVSLRLNNKYYSGGLLEIIKESEKPSEIYIDTQKINNYKTDHHSLTKGSRLIFR